MITLHPHGELTAYFGRVHRVEIATTPGITIAALLEQLGVPAGEVWISARNGSIVPPEEPLADGDVLELFSPIAGGEGAAACATAAPPASQARIDQEPGSAVKLERAGRRRTH